MSVAYDAVSNQAETTGDITSLGWNHTIGAITNGVVVVGLTWRYTAIPSNVAVTVDSVSAPKVTGTGQSQGLIASELYAVATGSKSGVVAIAVSWTEAAPAGGAAISFGGGNQATPVNGGCGQIYEYGDGAYDQAIASAIGDATMDLATNRSNGDNFISPTQTSRVNWNCSDVGLHAVMSTAVGAASNVHGWTQTNASRGTQSGVNIKIAAAAAAFTEHDHVKLIF